MAIVPPTVIVPVAWNDVVPPVSFGPLTVIVVPEPDALAPIVISVSGWCSRSAESVIAMIWTFAPHRGISSAPSGPHTAVVELRGEIDADGLAGSSAVVTSLRSAFEDEGSQAVVLLINSPGGSPVQAGIINDEIARLKKKHNKQ